MRRGASIDLPVSRQAREGASTTRLFGSDEGDVFLCEAHKDARLVAKRPLGVPAGAAAFMFGMLPWPTGQEPCKDCAA